MVTLAGNTPLDLEPIPRRQLCFHDARRFGDCWFDSFNRCGRSLSFDCRRGGEIVAGGFGGDPGRSGLFHFLFAASAPILQA